MKKYDFTMEDTFQMHEAVCEECVEFFQTGEDIPNIKITIGNHYIVIPTTADNIEEIFGAIQECIENTI